MKTDLKCYLTVKDRNLLSYNSRKRREITPWSVRIDVFETKLSCPFEINGLLVVMATRPRRFINA